MLFAGLMLTPEGPKLLEFNVRFGDPEAQVVVPRITSDVPDLLAAASEGNLRTTASISDDAVVCVVCTTPGYPEAPSGGGVVTGMDDAAATTGALVFSGGIDLDESGRLVTRGGRVLNVCGRGPTHDEARTMAYRAAAHLHWPGMQLRHDIGLDMQREPDAIGAPHAG